MGSRRGNNRLQVCVRGRAHEHGDGWEGEKLDFDNARCCNGFPTKAMQIMCLSAFYCFDCVQDILRFWMVSDTKMTTVLRVSESAVVEVVEKLVGDTGIEPVASSV